MASQVLSGSSNVSYTNNTGKNVRVVINYMQNVKGMSWAGVSEEPKIFSSSGRTLGSGPLNEFAIGKGIENFIQTHISTPYTNVESSFYMKEGGNYPVEIALAPTETFSAVCGPYNIVVIKEDGN